MKKAIFVLAALFILLSISLSCSKDVKKADVAISSQDEESSAIHSKPRNSGTAYITEVRWSTPEWEDFTNADGTGLYHDIISAIYQGEGLRVVVSYKPWDRAKAEVEAGYADMTGADSVTDKYAQPSIPITMNVEMVFFPKKLFPAFSGIDDLENKKGIWASGYIDNMPESVKAHLVGGGNPSREGALLMVLAGRADYYLDNEDQMAQTLKQLEGRYDPELFSRSVVYAEALFMCFTKSVRGQRLADMFDRGMRKLWASGELEKIYRKWGYSMPSSVYWR